MIRPTGFNTQTCSASELVAYFERHEKLFKQAQSGVMVRERRGREDGEVGAGYEVSVVNLRIQIEEMEAVTLEASRRLSSEEPVILCIPLKYWSTIFWGASVACPATSYASKYAVNTDFVYNDVGYALGMFFASLSVWTAKKESALKEEKSVYKGLLEKVTTIAAGKTIVAFLQRSDSETLSEPSFRALCRKVVSCPDTERDFWTRKMKENIRRMDDEGERGRFLGIFREYVEEREASAQASQQSHTLSQHPRLLTDHTPRVLGVSSHQGVVPRASILSTLPRNRSSEELPSHNEAVAPRRLSPISLDDNRLTKAEEAV